MNSPELNRVPVTQFSIETSPDPNAKELPFEQIQRVLRRTETYITRLIAAVKTARAGM